MYCALPRLQWCWAHLKRDFQALIDSGDHQVTGFDRRWVQRFVGFARYLQSSNLQVAFVEHVAVFDYFGSRDSSSVLEGLESCWLEAKYPRSSS
jgi:hypothetical protein